MELLALWRAWLAFLEKQPLWGCGAETFNAEKFARLLKRFLWVVRIPVSALFPSEEGNRILSFDITCSQTGKKNSTCFVGGISLIWSKESYLISCLQFWRLTLPKLYHTCVRFPIRYDRATKACCCS